MSVQFNIKSDMTPAALLDEIRGKISGETQQQIQQFESALDVKTNDNYPVLAIKVDEVNKTAVVRVTETMKDKLGLPDFAAHQTRNWVMGINDEGQYYAHEVQNVPPRINSLESLMSWMNREDEGFHERVQGDIVMQFVPYRDMLVEQKSGERYIVMTARKFRNSCRLSELELLRNIGNHRLYVPEGGLWGFITKNKVQYLVVSGQELILLHPQHGEKKVQIPKGTVALLTGQRGRQDRALMD